MKTGTLGLQYYTKRILTSILIKKRLFRFIIWYPQDFFEVKLHEIAILVL